MKPPLAWRTDLEIGMPLTGRHRLAEVPLLKHVGHERWKGIERATGVRTREIVDRDGVRLYATFYYVEIDFPEAHPLAAWDECDEVVVHHTLRARETHLDGLHVWCPRTGPLAGPVPADPVASPLPRLRTSNVFIRQAGGPANLAISIPANVDLARSVGGLDAEPETVGIARAALKALEHFPPPPGFESLGAERDVPYAIVPDRDLNGAGLVYFAHYVAFCDVAERAVLAGALAPEAIDRRSVYRRRITYYANARADDRIVVATRVAVRADPPAVWSNAVLRRDDGKVIAVSSALKAIAP